VDGVLQSANFVDLGSGGTLGTLPSATGFLLISGVTDADVPGSPIRDGSQMGPVLAVFNADLTASEETAISAFLSPKNPTTFSRLIICDGNSLTFGTGALTAYAYPLQLRYKLPQTTGVVNLGVGGKTTAQLTSDFAAKVQPYFQTGAELVFFEARNSLVAGNTPAQELALQKAYGAAARAAGWRLRVCTAPPTADAAAANIDAFNVLLRADHAWADDFTDLAACPELTPAGSGSNPTYYFDSTHLNAAGYGVLAAKLFGEL
jgi:lysophospholipase L1-like esterase